MVTYCSTEDLKQQIAQDPMLRVIDVREPVEYAACHIEQSKLCPAGELKKIAPTFGKESNVVLVCRSGRRATKAAEQMLEMGFESVQVLHGGILEWQAQGLPVKADSKVWPLERQVRLAAGLLVFAGTLLGVLINPRWLIVPGFVGAGLTFAALTDTCGMAMLLAQAPWNQTHRNACGSEKCS